MIDEINKYDMEVFLAFQKVIHEPEVMDIIRDSRKIPNLDRIIDMTQNRLIKGE